MCVFLMNQVHMIQCHRKMASERRVASAIRSPINARGLQLNCARLLHESLFMAVLMYGRRRRGLQLELYRWRNSEAC